MKTSLLYMLSLLLAAKTAAAQENIESITASLGIMEEAAYEEYFVPATGASESNAILNFIRPVTVEYKAAPWFLLVVDVPDEKQVVHFTQEQLEAISAIVKAKDGKTHYLQVTSFFEVFTGRESTVIDNYFVNSVRFAIRKRHWYRNNALFMVSSLEADGTHVIRFQMPFPNEARICKHLKDAHNLEEGFHEATPAEFMDLFTPRAATAFVSGDAD